MKKQRILKSHARSGLRIWVVVFFFITAYANAQIYKLMPIGDSVTWGKVNQGPPPTGTEGYRKPLHENLTAEGMNVTFVGDSGSVENRGIFADGARIGWFIHPDSAMGDISAKLNIHQPEIVILHIGTNNIGPGQPIGNYAMPGSMMNQLYTLVQKIVDNSYVKYLLLPRPTGTRRRSPPSPTPPQP